LAASAAGLVASAAGLTALAAGLALAGGLAPSVMAGSSAIFLLPLSALPPPAVTALGAALTASGPALEASIAA
jgi:hypothetical protein